MVNTEMGMRDFLLFFAAATSSVCLALPASAQRVDCNAIARESIVKELSWQKTDYAKLIFLSSLTQMDLQKSKEALEHSGKVSFGPISIGPGTWGKEKQEELRK